MASVACGWVNEHDNLVVSWCGSWQLQATDSDCQAQAARNAMQAIIETPEVYNGLNERSVTRSYLKDVYDSINK